MGGGDGGVGFLGVWLEVGNGVFRRGAFVGATRGAWRLMAVIEVEVGEAFGGGGRIVKE